MLVLCHVDGVHVISGETGLGECLGLFGWAMLVRDADCAVSCESARANAFASRKRAPLEDQGAPCALNRPIAGRDRK